jgi:hypothetical protein
MHVGQRLEQRQRDDDLADAARVLFRAAVHLGVEGPRGVGDVEHGDAVGAGVAAEQRADLGAEGAVGRGQLEIRVVDESEPHLVHPLHRTRANRAALEQDLVGEVEGFQA